jgi:AbrB family looped-hinge helix DNA binding protein
MAALTSKGQITIPKRMREALELEAGDGVVFELREGEVVLRKVRRKSILTFGGVAGKRKGRAGA